jgi:hypothetical protein
VAHQARTLLGAPAEAATVEVKESRPPGYALRRLVQVGEQVATAGRTHRDILRNSYAGQFDL